MNAQTTTTERYYIKKVIKFGMLFGYEIIDTKDYFETLYEYGEDELLRAESKVRLMNLLNKS